jgi:ribosomal protein S18 acetylase RimI-like enzyme
MPFIVFWSHLSVIAQHGGSSPSYQNFDTEVTGMPGKYAPPRGELLLARRYDGAPLGGVALGPLDADALCEMKRLYVSPEARGFELGAQLVEAIVREAKRIGYREMWLDTLPSMAEALGLYRRHGFAPTAPYYDTPVAGTIFLHLVLG